MGRDQNGSSGCNLVHNRYDYLRKVTKACKPLVLGQMFGSKHFNVYIHGISYFKEAG